MKVVLALAHEMDSEGNLKSQTRSRVDCAIRYFRISNADRLMFIGWDYRPDTDLPICVAMGRYCQSQTDIPETAVLLNSFSRDTVGDAILSRIQLEAEFDEFDLTVVTSQYHASRASRIFGRVYGSQHTVQIMGDGSSEVYKNSEADSLAAFEKTFSGLEDGDLSGFIDRMLTGHPFYNGSVFSDKQFPAKALGVFGSKA